MWGEGILDAHPTCGQWRADNQFTGVSICAPAKRPQKNARTGKLIDEATNHVLQTVPSQQDVSFPTVRSIQIEMDSNIRGAPSWQCPRRCAARRDIPSLRRAAEVSRCERVRR